MNLTDDSTDSGVVYNRSRCPLRHRECRFVHKIDGTPRFSVRGKIAAWLIVVALTLVAAEIAARIVFPLPEITNISRARYSPHQLLVPDLSQTSLAHGSFRYESAPDDAESVHELNLYGFRDADWS